MTKRLAVASHVALIDGRQYDGIGNVVIETLGALSADFMFVRHSMDGLLPSEIHSYKGVKRIQKARLWVLCKPAPIRYMSEMIATVCYFTFRQKVDIYVGIDPLNAVAGVLLKKLGRVEKTVFYTPDYSPQRFSNQTLNKIYHSIDRYCVKNADEVWSVSSKIVAIRKDMGLDDAKNIFIPNVPPAEYNYLRRNKHDKYNLVTNGIVDKQLDSAGTIEAVALLKDRMPKISFTIIGNGPDEERLRALAEKRGVADRIHFKGRLSLGETLKYTSKAGIGLALYTGIWGFNEFGDSTKSREYFNFGLPVISTNTHATVEEIQKSKAGVIVERSPDVYVKAIETVIKDYDVFSKASKKLGEKYEGIHKKEFNRLLK